MSLIVRVSCWRVVDIGGAGFTVTVVVRVENNHPTPELP